MTIPPRSTSIRRAGYAKQDSTTATGYSPPTSNAGYNLATYAGSFWDTPRFNTQFDIGAVSSTTGALQTAVGGRGGGWPPASRPNMNTSAIRAIPRRPHSVRFSGKLLSSEQIYMLTPRVNPTDQNSIIGGYPNTSMGGTVRMVRGSTAAITTTTSKKERLYASLDELLFSETFASGTPAVRTTNDTYLNSVLPAAGPPSTYPGVSKLSSNYQVSGAYTVGSASTTGVMNPATLDKIKFFLTTSSRAPDLNLYGTPRVTIWPVAVSPSDRSVLDQSIAFCSNGRGGH